MEKRTVHRNLSDAMLVRGVIQGEDLACSALMQRYRPSLRFEIGKMIYNHTDAEDLTIQGFAKAFINIQQYSSEFAFSTWLFNISKNNCIDFLRRGRKKSGTISIDADHFGLDGLEMKHRLASNALSPEDQLIKSQRAKQLYKIVAKLDPRYRRVIKLFYFQELSHKEVAETLGMPINTVKVNLLRGRNELYRLYNISGIK
ncbi:MAG: sigma-70 family RNA polymerase sigma factor [Flavobacteriales bacterium]|nr:sigma-70 family RNA polymerase sigma factor [Flavobacteriales bacterium]MBL4734420.1 sigma-70 family RNA polymerase sigma factor [Flavobacteriales bacterium]